MQGEVHDASDYVIVGAGSAGCVLANRLSARSSSSVTLLEAGGSDMSLWVKMPIGYGGGFHHPRLNWRYMSESDPGLGGRQSYWPRGKVLGGSSSINAMVFVRGQAQDFDAWAAAGNPGWSHADLLPHFRRMENNLAGEDEFRGTGGPIAVRTTAGAVHPLSDAFVAAASAAGYPPNPDFNGRSQEGVGLYQITTRGGFRCSAATGYLRPARRRGNLRLMTRAHVTRLLFEGRRTVGVEYLLGGRTFKLQARREVILAAGAVNSPQILQLSGIGDPARLSALGIDVVHANRAVGANLQDHVGFDYVYEANRPTLNDVLGPWLGRASAGLRYLLTRDGPLSLSVNQAGGFVKSDAARETPNIQLYFSPASYTRAVPGKRRLMSPDRFSGMMLGISNCRPRSRGWLHVTSADPLAAPAIHPGYFSDPADMEEMLAGAHILRRIAKAQPLRGVIAREVLPGEGVSDEDAMREDIRARAGSVFHPCLRDGAGSGGGGGCGHPAQGPRSWGAEGGGRLDISDDPVGKPQRARDRDRREGRGDDPGGIMSVGHPRLSTLASV